MASDIIEPQQLFPQFKSQYINNVLLSQKPFLLSEIHLTDQTSLASVHMLTHIDSDCIPRRLSMHSLQAIYSLKLSLIYTHTSISEHFSFSQVFLNRYFSDASWIEENSTDSGFKCGCGMSPVKRAGKGKHKILKSMCLVNNNETQEGVFLKNKGKRKETKLEKEKEGESERTT